MIGMVRQINDAENDDHQFMQCRQRARYVDRNFRLRTAGPFIYRIRIIDRPSLLTV